jgi:hypothetical protein
MRYVQLTKHDHMDCRSRNGLEDFNRYTNKTRRKSIGYQRITKKGIDVFVISSLLLDSSQVTDVAIQGRIVNTTKREKK